MTFEEMVEKKVKDIIPEEKVNHIIISEDETKAVCEICKKELKLSSSYNLFVAMKRLSSISKFIKEHIKCGEKNARKLQIE
jgi:hypothetical protein